jgi:glycine/D-amino acid oxidase-like deaminating enzyme
VAVVGCGSVGSLVAWGLAGRGVGHLTLVDRDTLAPENLCRHFGRTRDLGRAKTDVVADFLLDHYDDLNVSRQPFCVRRDPDRLAALLGATDLAVVAIDDEAAKYLVDALLWERGLPGIYLGVYGGGWGAEAILVDPARRTPCYGCAANALGRAGVSFEPPTPGFAYALAFSESASSEWRRATVAHLMPIAALGADIATARLEAGWGHARRLGALCVDGASARRLAMRRIEAWAMAPWETAPVEAERSDDCPLCGLLVACIDVEAEFATLAEGAWRAEVRASSMTNMTYASDFRLRLR